MIKGKTSDKVQVKGVEECDRNDKSRRKAAIKKKTKKKGEKD